MKIREHRLQGDVLHEQAADHGGQMVPEAIVLHYTAGGKADGSVHWLSKEDQVYVSAHIVIARGGEITQLLPFNTVAWHAGRSNYLGRTDWNKFSIGIELANRGFLAADKLPADINTAKCNIATHKSGTPSGWWESYPQAQVQACANLLQVLTQEYSIPEYMIVGHDDISPGRKIDPGPMLDMDTLMYGAEPLPMPTVYAPGDIDEMVEKIHLTIDSVVAEWRTG